MITLTRGLFSSVLKAVRADCICDVGSRDGDHSLYFRHLMPDSVVLAFEANPRSYQNMAARSELKASRIEIFPYAIADRNGRAKFHVVDADYSNPADKPLMGQSSLLVHEELRIKEIVEVETRRIDEFILSRYPGMKRIGLWVDVEGAEYRVVEGMIGIKDRVVALHVETARTPMRIGQKTTSELIPLLASMGFLPCGSNIGSAQNWGDMVFLKESVIEALGWKLTALRLVGPMGVLLQKHTPWLYNSLRTSYRRSGL